MEVYINALKQIVEGIPATLGLTIAAIFVSLILGILLSIGVRAKNSIVHIIFQIVSSFLKGIPILVFLYLFNASIDVIMGGLSTAIPFFTYDIRKPPTFLFAVLALALSYTPYMCDMVVTAMQAIPIGQFEACDAYGFNGFYKMTHIIIPQCITVAIPNFGNHFVNLLKATSLTCMVTIMEIMGEARNFATMNQKFLESYITCALVYWVIFLIFERIFALIEKAAGSYLSPTHVVRREKVDVV